MYLLAADVQALDVTAIQLDNNPFVFPTDNSTVALAASEIRALVDHYDTNNNLQTNPLLLAKPAGIAN